MIAIIGGSGFGLQGRQPLEEADTPYGKAWLTEFTIGAKKALFLPRHGPNHAVPPHRINYRANIWALKEKGVSDVFGSYSVGSLKPSLPPGTVVLLDQFLDFTKGRPATFFNGEDGRIVHAEMTHPYCTRLRSLVAGAAQTVGQDILPKGTYLCAEGPRFETAAEIALFGSLGGDVVGMTGVPEVILARELGICFSGVAVVTNFGAGLSETPPSHQEVVDLMARCGPQIWGLFEEVARRWTFQDCACRGAGAPEVK